MCVNLCDKYRPRTFGEVCGQDKAVKALVRLRDNGGLAGRAYWITGPSGVGKSTLARIIASEVADRFFIAELAAPTLTPARVLELEADSTYFGWGLHSGRAYIVNECHKLRRDTVATLLDVLERIPEHVVWLFTTTWDGQELLFEGSDDAFPLVSRCVAVKLTNQGLAKAGGAYVKAIAEREGLDGQDVSAYERLFKDNKNSFRAVLERIQGGAMRE